MVEHSSSFVPALRAKHFPVELRRPSGFRCDHPGTWPEVAGRLEYVGGRLLFMPPSGGIQQVVAASVVGILDRWIDSHSEYVVGGNETGMLLAGEVRGAEAAVWPRAALPGIPEGYIRMPPVLAVEVAGQHEGESRLCEKASWYAGHGVEAVWIVLPKSREVLALQQGERFRCQSGQSLPEHPTLPDLRPPVDSFFRPL